MYFLSSPQLHIKGDINVLQGGIIDSRFFIEDGGIVNAVALLQGYLLFNYTTAVPHFPSVHQLGPNTSKNTFKSGSTNLSIGYLVANLGEKKLLKQTTTEHGNNTKTRDNENRTDCKKKKNNNSNEIGMTYKRQPTQYTLVT